MTILGTRPELIRLSCIIPKLDQAFNHILVHTGQNHDPRLNDIFFSELSLRPPDHYLGVSGKTLGNALGSIIIECERVLIAERPDAVLILGDTNSAMSAIIARRLKIPVYHLEAGNRSFDRNVPEELNRKIVDHVSDFNLVYTEHARRNLLAEGLPSRRIYLVGSPLREVIEKYRDQICSSNILTRIGRKAGGYVLASMHREENVDNSIRFRVLIEALLKLSEKRAVPVIFSTHPRTRDRLIKLSEPAAARLECFPPFGFFDYLKLQSNALCVVSDSGTVSEEAGILGFPAVSPRDSIERPEGLDAACVVASGVNVDAIVGGVDVAIRLWADRKSGISFPQIPREYLVSDTSDRVIGLIASTARISNSWDNIRRNDLT